MSYKFSELVDIPKLQALMDSFYQITGIPTAIIDEDRTGLTTSGMQDICVKFYRMHHETAERCKASNRELIEQLHSGHSRGHECKNHLLNYAFPLMVEGKHMATLFAGQFFVQPPDQDFFRCQAKKYDFDETAYLEALQKVPVVSEDRVKLLLVFFNNLSQILTEAGIGRLSQFKATAKAEQKFKEQQALLSCISAMVFFKDLKGRYLAANQSFADLVGLSVEEIVGKTTAEVFPNRDVTDFLEHDNLVLQTGQAIINVEQQIQGKDGKKIWVSNSKEPMIDPDGKVMGLVGILTDITHRIEMENSLKFMAEHDFLTGLPNRYALESELQRNVIYSRQGQCSALLMVDLDNFKLVNDALGHDVGDRVLVETANILKDSLPDDRFLARLGGDEFAVILTNVNELQARAIAEKLRTSFKDKISPYLQKERFAIDLSLSIGIVIVDGKTEVRSLLSRVDAALYKAKNLGRNQVVVIKPEDDILRRLNITNDIVRTIKNALQKEQFFLLFQPIVRLEDGAVLHHEVLLRLRGENGEIIPPGFFLPVAENFGYMPQIDQYVVKASLRALAQYPSLKVFINLSGVSLGNDRLLETIERKILNSGIDPSRLGFEVTETVAVQDLLHAREWIQRLKNLGCLFSLDDFGTGFSSFAYLRILPVDFIKIDGSFIKNIEQEAANGAIVQAMNAVAHAMGKKTVAEMVENGKVAHVLKELQVDYGQGFHLGKPLEVPLA